MFSVSVGMQVCFFIWSAFRIALLRAEFDLLEIVSQNG